MSSFDSIAGIYHFLRRDGAKEYQLLMHAGQFKKTDNILEVGGGTGAVAVHFLEEVKKNHSFGSIKKNVGKDKRSTHQEKGRVLSENSFQK